MKKVNNVSSQAQQGAVGFKQTSTILAFLQGLLDDLQWTGCGKQPNLYQCHIKSTLQQFDIMGYGFWPTLKFLSSFLSFLLGYP